MSASHGLQRFTQSPYRLPGSRRDLGADGVKGLLVIGMLFYHNSNPLFPANSHDFFLSVAHLLTFVSGSWVYLSGLIIALYYQPAFLDHPRQVSLRLWQRGLKLLGLFVVINILLVLARMGVNINPDTLPNFLLTTLLSGTGEASFEILVGIAYTLLLTPLVLQLGRYAKWVLLFFLGSLILAHALAGFFISLNLWAIACGMAGFLAGKLLLRLASRPYTSFYFWPAASLAMLFYFGMVYGYDHNKYDLFSYLIGISSLLALGYLSWPVLARTDPLRALLLLYGQHPLLAYLLQMLLIINLAHIESSWSLALPYLLNVVISGVLLAACLAGVEQALKHLDWARRIYRLIFL